MNFTWEDTNYYLRNYNKIKLELNLFLATNSSSIDTDISVKENNSGNKNEKTIVNKLTDKQYEKDSFALKCVDELYKKMSSKDSKIMMYKYIYCMTIRAIATKTNYSESTVKRVINTQRKKLLKKLNKIELFEPK